MAEEPKPSVFGYVNQEELIKRIDDVADDDLSSCFFDDTIQDVETAATDIFDIGVRNVLPADGHAAAHPFGLPALAVPPTFAPASVPTPPPATVVPPVLDQDAQARQAFILGGPSAINKARET